MIIFCDFCFYLQEVFTHDGWRANIQTNVQGMLYNLIATYYFQFL